MMDTSPPPPADPGIGLALSAAFLGVYAHGGFLCGLNQAGIFPGHIAAASAGSLAGGFYAAGLRGKALEEAVLSPALKQSYAELLMPVRGAPLGIGILTGMISGKRVVRHLKRTLPVTNIEKTPGIKLSIAVSDLRRSEGLFLTSGPLAESIMASCAIPMLFSGQQIGSREFHDGGILHSVPLEPFVSDPAIHTIYVHQIKYSAVRGGKQRLGVREAFVNAHRMLDSSLLERRRQDAERNGKRVIMLETHHPHPGFLQSKTAKKRYFDDGHLTGSTSRDSTP